MTDRQKEGLTPQGRVRKQSRHLMSDFLRVGGQDEDARVGVAGGGGAVEAHGSQ